MGVISLTALLSAGCREHAGQSAPQNLANHLEAEQVTLLTDDILDYGAVLRAAEGSDLVFHLAAQPNVMGAVRDPDYSFATNVVGTFNVPKTAAYAGMRRVVFASSCEVYGEPESAPMPEDAPLAPKGLYGASKMAGEAYCRAWGSGEQLECQILRFANIYGKRDRERVIPYGWSRLQPENPCSSYGGDQILDFIEVRHCVGALLAATEGAVHGPITVGSGTGTRLPDLAERIIQLIGGR